MSRADRERQILDVAERVFADQGFQATSMDEIADLVGVSKPLIYDYFGSKDGLLLACIARARAGLYEMTRAAMNGPTSAHDVMRSGILAYFTFMDDHARSFAMLLQEPMVVSGAASAGGTTTAEAIEGTRRQQRDLIAPVLGAFLPAAPAQAVEAYTEIIIGACERLALWRLRHPDVTAEDATRHMTDFSWHGLAALTGTGSPT